MGRIEGPLSAKSGPSDISNNGGLSVAKELRAAHYQVVHIVSLFQLTAPRRATATYAYNIWRAITTRRHELAAGIFETLIRSILRLNEARFALIACHETLIVAIVRLRYESVVWRVKACLF